MQSEYHKEYYRKNREKLKNNSRKNYDKNKNDTLFLEKRKLQREIQHFGIPRDVIFKKTNGKCMNCENTATVVHHLDEDGRGNEKLGLPPGKNPDRLIPLCRACHINIHREKTMLSKKLYKNGFWSKTVDRCIHCGRDDIPHGGHGYCKKCYYKQSYRHRRVRRVVSEGSSIEVFPAD